MIEEIIGLKHNKNLDESSRTQNYMGRTSEGKNRIKIDSTRVLTSEEYPWQASKSKSKTKAEVNWQHEAGLIRKSLF